MVDRGVILKALIFERDDLRMRLLTEDKELYGEYDRVVSESEFRFNVTWPLLIMLILISIDLSYWWLLGLLPLAWLCFQGILKNRESLAVLMRAVLIEKIIPPETSLLRRAL
jgi:hypothetical protein